MPESRVKRAVELNVQFLSVRFYTRGAENPSTYEQSQAFALSTKRDSQLGNSKASDFLHHTLVS